MWKWPWHLTWKWLIFRVSPRIFIDTLGLGLYTTYLWLINYESLNELSRDTCNKKGQLDKTRSWKGRSWKRVGENHKMLVTSASGIKIPKMSPTSKFCYQHSNIVTNIKSPTSLSAFSISVTSKLEKTSQFQPKHSNFAWFCPTSPGSKLNKIFSILNFPT